GLFLFYIVFSRALSCVGNPCLCEDSVARLEHRSGDDAMCFIICLLSLATSVGFVYGNLHGVRYRIGIHDHLAVLVSRSTADSLYQRALVAEKTFFVSVEDRYE